jgi:hypothetical protein
MMAAEYKKRGGGYNTSKEEGQDESQKHLDKWGKEEWQTKEGSGTARQDDDSRKRYLPKKAWEEMDEDEKEETEDKKVEESKDGKQFVGNTGTAKEARRRVSSDIDGKENGKENGKKNGKSGDGKDEDGKDEDGKDEDGKDEDGKDEDGKDEDGKDEKGESEEEAKSGNTQGDEPKKTGTKRKSKSQPAEKDNDRVKSLRKRK